MRRPGWRKFRIVLELEQGVFWPSPRTRVNPSELELSECPQRASQRLSPTCRRSVGPRSMRTGTNGWRDGDLRWRGIERLGDSPGQTAMRLSALLNIVSGRCAEDDAIAEALKDRGLWVPLCVESLWQGAAHDGQPVHDHASALWTILSHVGDPDAGQCHWMPVMIDAVGRDALVALLERAFAHDGPPPSPARTGPLQLRVLPQLQKTPPSPRLADPERVPCAT